VSARGLGVQLVPVLERTVAAAEPGKRNQIDLFVLAMAKTAAAISCTTGSSRWSPSTATIASSVGLELSFGSVTTSLASNSRALAMMLQTLSGEIDRSGVF
jgi:hypothetical protein